MSSRRQPQITRRRRLRRPLTSSIRAGKVRGNRRNRVVRRALREAGRQAREADA